MLLHYLSSAITSLCNWFLFVLVMQEAQTFRSFLQQISPVPKGSLIFPFYLVFLISYQTWPHLLLYLLSMICSLTFKSPHKRLPHVFPLRCSFVPNSSLNSACSKLPMICTLLNSLVNLHIKSHWPFSRFHQNCNFFSLKHIFRFRFSFHLVCLFLKVLCGMSLLSERGMFQP